MYLFVSKTVIIFFVLSFPLSYLNADSTENNDIYLDLVKNVVKVASIDVYEGPIKPLHSSWKAIIGGDDDTKVTGVENPTDPSLSNLTMIARTYGQGRVVAASVYLGAEDIYDNTIIMKNISDFLNQGNSKQFAFSSGHGEWVHSTFSGFYTSLLEKIGYNVRKIDVLTSDNLKEIDVLFVGNAWEQFTNDEIADVESFVKKGGGLYLQGLGWSWNVYHEDLTINDYPMSKISQPYKCLWQHGSFMDPTHNIENNPDIPFYHIFYPNVNNNYTLKDSDNDGVIDQWDSCPKTPENSCVNNKGCSCDLSIIDEKGSVTKGKWKTYYASIGNTYSNFTVKILDLTEDVDLYVKNGSKPDFHNFDCRPYKGGKRDEICDLNNSGDNIWYFSVYGYKSGDFTISVQAKR